MPFHNDRNLDIVPICYGGVLVWMTDNIACKRCTDLEPPKRESMWLEIGFENKNIFICVGYHKPCYTEFCHVLQHDPIS